MSGFLNHLDYRDLDGETWLLLRPLRYYSETAGGMVVVPRGFKTDLASIPRFFHRVIPKSGRHNYAAVVHDYLYKRNGIRCVNGIKKVLSRQECDMVFLEGMAARECPAWRRWVMYWAVRLCGWRPWNGHVRKNSAGD